LTAKQKKTLEATLRLIPGYDPFVTAGDAWLDHDRAKMAIEFFPEMLHHIEGDVAGQPFALEPWEQAIIGNLFGWVRQDAKGRIVRRYRKCLLYVPRKNGKTPLAAGICLYVLFCDGEPGAQIYGAGASGDQAAKLYRHAVGMVRREPMLEGRCTIYGGQNARSIVLKEDEGSSYRVISADAPTAHGGNSHMVLIDELHALENGELVEVMETSMASEVRAQPLLVYITTADYDRPSVCNRVHKYACAVRDNGGDPAKPGFDPTFLPVIYEAGKDDDWRWTEQWLPHASWFLYAVASGSD
jgi:phage terminase large subunit-like protein